jgi:protoporphyrinogen oxidase
LKKKTAVIIGAGPAGLTAAYELLRRTDIVPLVLERSTYMGGISRTVNYKGNRIDIGGHRFFSKSNRVMEWWFQHLPMQKTTRPDLRLAYQGKTTEVSASQAQADPEITDEVMLVRKRKSRIYYLRQFFDYPIQLNLDTLVKLGFFRTLKIGLSYMKSALFPKKNVLTLEQFFIHRFGQELYRTFFKDYTEKVWGVPCSEISAEWGEQRIKGLSVSKAIVHSMKRVLNSMVGKKADVIQKDTETSLIENFLYPKYGPGQMWDTVARKVEALGGKILTEIEVTGINCAGGRVTSLVGRDVHGECTTFEGDYFFSTMAIKDLIRAFTCEVPAKAREVSEGLIYRDFITVGLLVKKLKVGETRKESNLIADNWIYIQEPDVLAGRLQIFNNWSPYLVADSGSVWLGVEYFCFAGDQLWQKPDAEIADLAKEELHRIGIIDRGDVIDATVIRMPKTYPAYFGTYQRFGEVREYLDSFENLFLLGRNGMHKYNNQDHSMLTAMVAVDAIVAGEVNKDAIWQVNTEMEYHESK